MPLLWTVVNLALLATVAGMLLVRQKFSGLDLARTLKITLAALAANALVAIAAFGLGFGLRAGVLALAG